MRFPRQPIFRSLVLFALLYLTFSVSAVFCTPSSAAGLRALSRWIFAQADGPRELSFEAVPAASPHRSKADTRIVIANRNLLGPDGSGPVRNVELPLGRIGATGAALLMALTLASPIPWARRFRALGAGFLLFLASILAILTFVLWLESADLYLVAIRPDVLQILRSLQKNLLPSFGLVLPMLIWLVTTLRTSDLAPLFNENGEPLPKQGSPMSDLKDRRV